MQRLAPAETAIDEFVLENKYLKVVKAAASDSSRKSLRERCDRDRKEWMEGWVRLGRC